MKKIAALVMSALVIGSLSGCANRNAANRGQYYGVNRGTNQGTTQGTTQGTRTGYGTTNMGTTQGAYRDGIYTGEGDRTGNTNQAATVVISGGRITDITLRTLDAQGRDIGTGTGTGYTNNAGNTANAPGTRFYGTPGVTTGGANGGMSGYTGAPTGNTGYTTGDYSFQSIGGDAGPMMGGTVDGTTRSGNPGWTTGRTGTGNIGWASGRVGTGYGTDTGMGTGNTGWTTGGAGTTTGNANYDAVRRQIATAMINQQTADIALSGNDTSEARNWKLAVRRALDKARVGGTTGTTTGTIPGTAGSGTDAAGNRRPSPTSGAGGTGGTTR
jgi:hypothetical protein